MARAIAADPTEGHSRGEEVETGLRSLGAALASITGEALVAVLAVGSIGRAHASGSAPDATGVEDFDLIVIADLSSDLQRLRLRRRIDRMVEDVTAGWSIPVSVGVLLRRNLPRLRCTLFHYEMRYGHRVIAGTDPCDEMPAFDASNLPLIEATRLLLNRGVPLWGDCVLAADDPAARMDGGLVGRRKRKVILALGDALLIAAGVYHWSYTERQRIATTCREFDLFARWSLRELYVQALASKSTGVPTDWVAASSPSMLPRLLDLHERVFRHVEERRLERPVPDWSRYADGDLSYPRDLTPSFIRRARRAWRVFGAPRSIRFARMQCACAAEEVLLRNFPALAFVGPAALDSLTSRLNAPRGASSDRAVWEHFHRAWARGQ